MKRLLLVALLAAFSLQAYSQSKISILHGPYLQNLTESEVTIVWVSDKTSVGWVETAPDDGSHYYAVERPKIFDAKNGIKTESRVHSVKLTGLKSGTTYRYRVYSQEVVEHKGNSVLYGRVAATEAYRKAPLQFTTSDPAKKNVTFAMINDIHGNNDRLRKLLGLCDVKKLDFVTFLGDMASSFNSEEQVFGDFMDTAVEMFASETPMYYTRGNHETRGNIAYDFQDYFSTLSDHIYYSYRQGPVYFIALDCGEDKPDSDIEYAGINVYDQYRSEQAEWLRKIVATDEFKTAPFKLVTVHMPPFAGWHGECDIREKFLPILNDAGIDIMLCGHHHKLIKKAAGEEAAFPILVNSNDTVLKGDISSDKLNIVVLDESGKKVEEITIKK